MMAERIKLIQELKRRGYSVVETVDNALLIEKDTFWGKFGYDAGVGLDVSKIKWGRTIILAIAYGIGIIGGLYWLYRKGQMKQEVVSIIV